MFTHDLPRLAFSKIISAILHNCYQTCTLRLSAFTSAHLSHLVCRLVLSCSRKSISSPVYRSSDNLQKRLVFSLRMATDKKNVGTIPTWCTDCMPGCTSAAHRSAIVAAVTRCKTPNQLIQLLTCICSTGRPWRVKDDNGKSMFHLAASLGRINILEWYLRSRGFHRRSNHDRTVLVDDVDLESGWSALHRAAFQGGLLIFLL